MFQLAPWLMSALCVLALLYRYHFVNLITFSLSVAAATLILVLGGQRATRGTSRLQAALAVDHKFAFQGNFVAAYEFSGAAKPDGFAQLAIHEAGRRLPVSSRGAIAISVPRSTASLVVLLIGLVGLVFVPTPHAPALAQPTDTPRAAPVSALSSDDAELLKQRAAQLQATLKSEEARRFASDFNDLVIKLSNGSLSQSEGFKEAAALFAELEQTAKEGEALAQGLIQRGEILRKKNVTRDAGRALSERRFADAQEALKKLAERLKSGDQGLSKQELEELRASLEQLRKEQEQAQKSNATEPESERAATTTLEKKRDDLQKKKDQGTASSDDMKQLAETERELKRLSRERKQKQAEVQQTLSELDQKLQEAAQALAQERQKSGEFLQEAAQQMKQAATRTLSDEEKKELIKQLEALKERLREQNKQGNQADRMRDFQRRARGQNQQPGEGEGEQGAGQTKGQPQVMLAPGGAPIPQPGQGQEGQGQPGEGESEDASAAGQEAGHAHDEHLQGEASRLKPTALDDKAAAGRDNGQGNSASETIASAAERGFVSGNYQKLYHEYETVAEEVMDKDQIPPGRRTHIRRYFELIRPREGQ